MPRNTSQKIGAMIGHPIRRNVIELMLADTGRRWSPRELTDTLEEAGVRGAKLGNVSYHVRTMRDAGLLKRAGKEQRRGALEHYYRLNLDELAKVRDDVLGVLGRITAAIEHATGEVGKVDALADFRGPDGELGPHVNIERELDLRDAAAEAVR